MKPVYINGIGIISRCAKSADELADICSGGNYNAGAGKLDFKTDIPSSKLRRCSRYSKIAAAAAELARTDGKIPDDIDKMETGTIISTGYGASENNIRFSDSVVNGDPALCSPTVFSGTVPNSCVGQICIINGYKGVSTVLMGGDPFEYSALLLGTNRADIIFAGSVEEYSEELTASVKSAGIIGDREISEGAAIMALSADETVPHYCKITSFGSASLGRYPYVHRTDSKSAISAMTEVIRSVCGEKIPDMVFTSENGSYFDEYERKAVNDILGEKIQYYAPKKLFGESLGCGYALSIALAAVSLKIGKAPNSAERSTADNDLKSILVSGIDTVGNYLCAFMEVQYGDS